jgi:hypothetical protein
VEDYKNALESGIDMVTAQIKIERYISKPSNKPSWWVGQFHWVSAHALGLLIRKNYIISMVIIQESFQSLQINYLLKNVVKVE